MLDEALNKCADNNNYTIYTSMCKAQRILMRSYDAVCSISGGSDSDIVLDLIHKVDEDGKVKYFWIDTGLEYTATMGVWYGYCNDRFLIELENGTQFTTKICDSKGYADDGEGKYHNFGGNGKCIVEFIYDDGNLPSCVAFSGSWGYYNWNGLDLGANIKSIKKINYGEPVDY